MIEHGFKSQFPKKASIEHDLGLQYEALLNRIIRNISESRGNLQMKRSTAAFLISLYNYPLLRERVMTIERLLGERNVTPLNE